MATSQNSNAWFVYDQRVRMDRQARGLPWEVFNIGFYIMATRAKDSNRFIISKCSSSVSTIPSPSVGRAKGTSKGTVASTIKIPLV
jgi:hypothetical protein